MVVRDSEKGQREDLFYTESSFMDKPSCSQKAAATGIDAVYLELWCS